MSQLTPIDPRPVAVFLATVVALAVLAGIAAGIAELRRTR